MEKKTDTSRDDQQLSTDEKMTEEPRDTHPTITGKKYFILSTGKPQEDIIRNVLQQIPRLKKVYNVAECDVILVFCTIVSFSREGTDIDAAVNELNALSESKPAVLMVLHHTFDPEKIVLESSRYVTRMNTLTADCLFHEDKGLLKCVRNNEALKRIKQCVPPQNLDWQGRFRAFVAQCQSNLFWLLSNMSSYRNA